LGPTFRVQQYVVYRVCREQYYISTYSSVMFVCVCYKCCSIRCSDAGQCCRCTVILHSISAAFCEQPVWDDVRCFTSLACPLCSLLLRLLVPASLQCIPVSILLLVMSTYPSGCGSTAPHAVVLTLMREHCYCIYLYMVCQLMY